MKMASQDLMATMVWLDPLSNVSIPHDMTYNIYFVDQIIFAKVVIVMGLLHLVNTHGPEMFSLQLLGPCRQS